MMHDPIAYMIAWPVWSTYAAIIAYFGHLTGAYIARRLTL